MKQKILLNIVILIGIAALTYALTLYFGHTKMEPTIQSVPVTQNLQDSTETGEQVPDFSFTTINGKTHAITDFKGKTVILNFWASWCAPCVKEMPLLLKAAHDNKDNVLLIALSSDVNEQAIHNFISKMENKDTMNFAGENIHIALDENQAITADIFGTFMLPETFIIAPDQTLRHKFVGANWTEEDLTSWLQKLRN